MKEIAQQDETILDSVTVPNNLQKLRTHSEFSNLLSISSEKLAKKHPQVNAKYLGIETVEQMLDAIFPCWSFVGTDRGVMANSVYYEGILTVNHPVTNQEYKRSGIGAVNIQLSKGAKPMEIEKINPTAIQRNLPTAKAYALKNAAQSLGNILGRNLNRDTPSDMSKLWDNENRFSKVFKEEE